MIDTTFLKPLHDSAISEMIRTSSWMFPALETAHFTGLCLLIGSVMVMDLRLVGFIRQGSLKSTLRFADLAIAGFVINLLSGAGFFVSNPENYAQNPLFWIKMGLVLVAGLNLAYFELAERRPLLALPAGASPPLRTRLTGLLSLLLWASVIVAGRFLPLLGVG